MPHHPPFRKRLLIDGSPGATTLLLPAAHCAIPSFDVVLAADTGWFLDQSLDHLNVLRRIATGAGMDWVRAHTGDTARDSLGRSPRVVDISDTEKHEEESTPWP